MFFLLDTQKKEKSKMQYKSNESGLTACTGKHLKIAHF